MATIRRHRHLIPFLAALGSIAVVAACAPPGPALTDQYYQGFVSSAPLERTFSQRGGHDVAYLELPSENAAIDRIGVWYPEDLGRSRSRYPMVMVVNASNTKASSYKPFFERLASWGFIVVGTEDPQAGSGQTTSAALDAVLGVSSDSVLHDRIDRDNIGIVGYSQGGAGAIRAVTAFDNGRLYKAMFTGSAAYSLLAKNLGWAYDASKINLAYFMTAGTGSSDDRGVVDLAKEFAGVAPLASLRENYEAVPSSVFKIRARIAGAEHGEMLTRTDGYMTAWMRFQLQSDPEAAAVFIGPDAELLQNRIWQDVEKNR